MAFISFQPKDNFKCKIYTGTGSSNALTGLGFQPDYIWIKDRDGGNSQMWVDSVRGAGVQLESNAGAAQVTQAQGVTAFDSDGFTLGTYTGMNDSGVDFASWNLKAGTTTGLTGGTITPSAYSFNATSGFSIIKYTGTGASATIPHGLGVKPTCIIIKEIDGTNNWIVYSESIGEDRQFLFNDTSASSANANVFGNTAPTSTVFTVANDGATGGSGQNYVAWCFASTKGYIKNGSYIGNGQSDRSGTFCYTGFAPSMVLLSRVSAGGNKNVFDDKRNPYNLRNLRLCANLTNADASSDTQAMEFHATGFKLRSTNTDQNGGGSTYWYLAFAEFPVVSSNSKSGTAQ
jgi:hypothetical protein